MLGFKDWACWWDSLGFGVVAQVVLWKSAPRWLWLVGAIGWFAGGMLLSEVMFATSTKKDIQPVIDGLAFDESLLGDLIVGSAAVVVAMLARRMGRRAAA